MFFLGQASTYKFRDLLRHTFAFGKKSDLNALRAHLAAHYGTTKDRVAVYHSGRTGLAVALDKLVGSGSEVIITSLTCFAVYEAVSEAGCIPIFADIDPEKLHFGPKELETALAFHPDVKAVVVQNNLGLPCDIAAIEKICKKRGLILIEDLAHSAGIRYADGREAGTVGSAVVLSFGKGKAIDTISGGAVIFTAESAPTLHQPETRPKLSDRLRDRWYPFFAWQIRGLYHLGNLGRLFTSLLLKLHFIQRSADAALDPSTRITYWQAKLALKKLQKIPRSGKKPLRDHFFVEDRDELLAELEKAGFIFDDIWYNLPVAPARYYRRTNFPEEECPMAVWAAEHLVNVPTWYPKASLKPALRFINHSVIEPPAVAAPRSKPRIKAQPAVEEELEFAMEDEYTEDLPDFDEEEYEETYDEPEEEEVYEEAERPSLSTDIDAAIDLLDDSSEEPEKPSPIKPKPSHATTAARQNPPESITEPADFSGTINYSELVYDKLDHTHLNRTNIIDKNTNSDGTSVSLTKEERRPKKTPLKNNLPKIRQYKKPETKIETTEGKVW